MEFVAERELLDPALIRDEVAAGRMVIPANTVHLAGRLEPMCIGIAARCKVNSNIGNSAVTSSLEGEAIRGLAFRRRRTPTTCSGWSTWVAPPGGESFDRGRRASGPRPGRAARRVPGRTVLLVSHVTPIKTLVRLALGAPDEALFRMHLDPGGAVRGRVLRGRQHVPAVVQRHGASALGPSSRGSCRRDSAAQCRGLAGQSRHLVPGALPAARAAGPSMCRRHRRRWGGRGIRGRVRRPGRRSGRNGPAAAARQRPEVGVPPAASAGKNFRSVIPRSSRASVSDAVDTPGRNGSPEPRIASSRRSVQPGLIRNRAPAATAAATLSGVSTVPAPTTASGTRARSPDRAQRGRRPQRDLDRRQPPVHQRPARAAPRPRASSSTTTGMTGARSSTEVMRHILVPTRHRTATRCCAAPQSRVDALHPAAHARSVRSRRGPAIQCPRPPRPVRAAASTP